MECATVCRTALHIISAQNNAPVMGCVQNTLLCMYICTETFTTPEETAVGDAARPNYKFPDGLDGYQTMIDIQDFMDAVVAADIDMDRFTDLIVRASRYYPSYVNTDAKGYMRFTKRIPGKIVASIVFPRTFTWSRKTEVNERLPVCDIKDGIILPHSGPLCKKSIGGTTNAAIHPLWKMSPDTSARIISEFQFMTTVLIVRIGFSMGISDCLRIKEKDEMVRKTLSDTMLQCQLINASDKDPRDKEREINGALNKAMGMAPELAKTGMNKGDRNALVIMKKSGAKGSDPNNGQIAGFVGQQNIDGKRIPFMISDGTRTLPHFFHGDNSPEARGFVSHSYMDGLTFAEAWFHAAGGRRGVVDTALKTGDSGYIQKKMVKKVEDCRICYDGTVRDAGNIIYQFAYGGDCFNAKEMMWCKGLDSPFFIDPITIANCLNSEAEYLFHEEGINIGKLRILNSKELNLLISFIQAGCPGVQSEVTERVTFNVRTCLRAIMSTVRVYEHMIPTLCRKIKDEFEGAKAKNGYMAGLVASSSIGEPTTQLTLNSVDRKELIYVRQGSKIILEPIGQFIDHIIASYPEEKIQRLPNKQIYVDVSHEGYEMTTCDEDGMTHWKALEAVTRHLPGGKLLKVTTHFGREVVATKGLSFLTRKKNKLVATAGADLQINDLLPVMKQFPNVKSPLMELDLRMYLSSSDYIYSSEMDKAWDLYQSKVKGWWKMKGDKFTIPYSRDDAFILGYQCHVLHTKPGKGNVKEYSLAKGCVYPKHSGKVVSELPEMLPLDFLTGFLFGAHIAEGCVTKTFVCISNNDETFRNMIYKFCDKYKIGHHTVVQNDKNFKGATSTDIKIHSTMMAKILGDSCGRGSPNKKIPEWALIAPDEFVKGLLNGYFSGDGCVNKKNGQVTCSTTSRLLIKGLCELLARFGMYGYMGVVQLEKNNIGSKNIFPSFSLFLRGNNSKIFAREIGMIVPAKHKKLQEVTLNQKYGSGNGRYDVIPIKIGRKAEQVLHTNEIRNIADELGDPDGFFSRTLNQDVYYDYIKSIEEVECSFGEDDEQWVYDVTIADTRILTTFGGVLCADTFHQAGQSAKDVTLGVPRLKEVMNATHKPSKPGCTVYLTDPGLKENFDQRKEADTKEERKRLDKEALQMVTEIAAPLANMTVENFLKSSQLRYLCVEGEARQSSPIGILTYEEYEPGWWVTLAGDLGNLPRFQPDAWVIILDFDLDKLYQFSITTETIAQKIEEEGFGSKGHCFSCIPSPTSIGQIEVYLNFEEIGPYTRSKIEGATTKRLLTEDNIDYFTAREVALKMIKKVRVQGIAGITKTHVHQDSNTNEWSIDTQGTNLMTLLGIPGIDPTRTISDDMWEVYYTFGIEAARKFLIKEITKILSFADTYINPRHITLLVDTMCRTGTITSVNRDGISREVAGPIPKGMFEKPVDNFGEAAAFAEHDKMKGVASAVMFGTLAEVGTGTVEIKDAEKLPARRPIKIPLKPNLKIGPR